MSLRIENKLDDAVGQRHLIQQSTFFQKRHGRGLGLRIRQGVYPHLLSQVAVGTQAALASCKRPTIGHGIHPVRVNVYDARTVYCHTLVDAQKIRLRQKCKQHLQRCERCEFFTIFPVDHRPAALPVQIQNIFCAEFMLFQPFAPVRHTMLPSA